MATDAQFAEWSRFDSGGPPDYVSIGSLDDHASWCVWHEGFPLFRNPDQIDDFRRGCGEMQRHNSSARDTILNATNNELMEVIARVRKYFHVPRNGGYKMADKHLKWVVGHEGKRAELLALLDAGEFERIRRIYQRAQDHDPHHVTNLLEALDDATIKELLDDMR